MAVSIGRSLWIGTTVLLMAAAPSLAQTGGSTSGGGGSSSASPGATAGPTGGSSLGTGSTGAAPAPSPFPTTPQRGLGSPQVPSSANAEPTSPVLQQRGPLQSQPPPSTLPDPAVSGSSANPEQMESGATGTGTGESGIQSAPNATAPNTPGSGTAGGLIGPIPISVTGPGRATGDGAQRLDSNRAAAGKTLEDCMAVWEPATHMTKEQWRRVCSRTSLDDAWTR